MVPESTSEELETANIAAQHCLTLLLVVKTKIDSQPEDVAPALLVEDITEPACMLLEGWRALRLALKPHVERDFIGVCVEPVEIGGIISVSAHASAFSLSHRALVYLSVVLMPSGNWPSTENPETDLLADLRCETSAEASENSKWVLRTGFNLLSTKELNKCIALVHREWAAVRRQLPANNRTTNQHSIEEIEHMTPQLNTQSMDWLAARKENEKKLGYPTSTLAKYRLESQGGRQLSQYFGIDKDGRRWRRDKKLTPRSTVYYFMDDLKNHGKKV